MPVINGVKMACEPCIRGHRSTKCDHAKERLMVPVKKPGRPLSACPHLNGQLCGCSSITAAIPRTSTCGCGTSTPPLQTQPLFSAVPDIPSPSKVAFKVQKSGSNSRPSSRKQSYDGYNLERMDPAHVNILPQKPKAQSIAPAPPNGHSMNDTQPYTNGHSHGVYMASKSEMSAVDFAGSKSYPGNYAPIVSPNGYAVLQPVNENYGVLAAQIPAVKSCCGSKKQIPDTVKVETLPHASILSHEDCGDSSSGSHSHNTSITSLNSPSSPMDTSQSRIQQIIMPLGFPPGQDMYNPYITQPTIYAYPSSYGSYSHPLQPSEWLQTVNSNMYAFPTAQTSVPAGSADMQSGPLAGAGETVHSCGCGDACQCLGCVAHPYNTTTNEYMLNYAKTFYEASPPTPSAFHTNGNRHGNGLESRSLHRTTGPYSNGNVQNAILEENEALASPQADTPSDTGTTEEQNLSASDYFFVSYPFPGSEDCGGDMVSCPCGDDCQCLGCTIHKPVFPDEFLLLQNEETNGGSIVENDENEAVDGRESTIPSKNGVALDRVMQAKKSCCG